MKPLELRGGAGVRNDVTPERFSLSDLQVGTNVDIDASSKLSRRGGTRKVLDGTFTSLWAHGSWAFLVEGGVLKRLNPDLTLTPLVSGVGPHVAYEFANEQVYWTDGSQSGVISSSGNRAWGLPVPSPVSLADAVGYMSPGRYLVSLVYVDEAGRESGASTSAAVDVRQGGISVAMPSAPSPYVVSKRLYVSTPGGELLYGGLTFPASMLNVVVTSAATGPEVRTLSAGGPPAGVRLAYFGGRMFVVRGEFVFYSWPFELDLFDLRAGFIARPSEVRVFAPVSDGVFIATATETGFLRGRDPTEWTYEALLPFGGVLGSECEVPGEYLNDAGKDTKHVMWVSERGVMLGSSGGDLQCVTKTRYTLPSCRSGASVVKVRAGTPQFLCSIFS